MCRYLSNSFLYLDTREACLVVFGRDRGAPGAMFEPLVVLGSEDLPVPAARPPR